MQLRSPWASPEIVDQILSIGREKSPAEACGIVTPDLRVVVLPNRHPTSTHDSFVIEAEDLVNAIQDFVLRSDLNPEQVRGITRGHFMVWHTHPGGQIGPSRGDIANKIEGFLNLVVTLPDGPATMF